MEKKMRQDRPNPEVEDLHTENSRILTKRQKKTQTDVHDWKDNSIKISHVTKILTDLGQNQNPNNMLIYIQTF